MYMAWQATKSTGNPILREIPPKACTATSTLAGGVSLFGGYNV